MVKKTKKYHKKKQVTKIYGVENRIIQGHYQIIYAYFLKNLRRYLFKSFLLNNESFIQNPKPFDFSLHIIIGDIQQNL